jgi:hypothetical protein
MKKTNMKKRKEITLLIICSSTQPSLHPHAHVTHPTFKYTLASSLAFYRAANLTTHEGAPVLASHTALKTVPRRPEDDRKNITLPPQCIAPHA